MPNMKSVKALFIAVFTITLLAGCDMLTGTTEETPSDVVVDDVAVEEVVEIEATEEEVVEVEVTEEEVADEATKSEE